MATATGQPKVRCWLVGIFIATLCTVLSNARVIEETGMFGELMSPGYPDTYPNNEDIQWNITVPKGYQIRLYFTLFDVEYAADCEYDFLKIKSGDRDIGKYCGTKEIMAESTPSDVILTSYPDNHVTVYFHSDFSNDKPFKGFVAHYYADDIDECATNNGGCDHACHNYETGYFCTCRMGFDLMDDQHQCIAACRDIEYTSTSGVLQSIDYPEVYPNNANCDWTINVESGYVIHFEFDFIDVESHPTVDCPYDFIMVEADGIRHGPYCGNHPETPLPPQIVTSGHELQVIFHSDGSVNQHGFQASYYVTAKPCVDIGPPTYGFMKGESFTFKESVQFSCKPGYNLVGSEIRTCMADGSWSGSEARCDLVDCGEPKPLLNGHILLYNRYNFTYTNDVGFKCDSLYDLIGPSFRTCGVDGRWSFDEPICVPKCGKSIVSPNQPQRSRIHGGHDVAQGSWPWQVLLHIHAQEQEFERAGKICGGSLINEEWVMTAAHCVTGGNSLHRSHFGQPIPEDSIRLVLGLHHRDNEDENTLSVHTSRIIVHPDYTAANYDADIALVQLNETVTLTQNIRPLCLPPQNPNANTTVGDEDTRVDIDNAGDSNQGVVIGWGQTTTSAISDVLKEVYVPVIDRHTCRESTDHDVTRNMVCAGVGGRDSCQGDSGGPLMLRNSTDLRFYAYGIVSWGDECGSADTYGVYTRVENYVDWVLQNSFIDRTNN